MKTTTLGITIKSGSIGWAPMEHKDNPSGVVENDYSEANKDNFKGLRSFLNLNIDDLAKILDVNERTIRRYEAGEPIRAGVYNDLKKIVQSTFFMLEKTIEIIEKNRPEQVNLLGYSDSDFKKYKPKDFEVLKSNKIHSKILLHVQAWCISQNIACAIIAFNSVKYFEWLTGEDSEVKRNEWVSDYKQGELK